MAIVIITNKNFLIEAELEGKREVLRQSEGLVHQKDDIIASLKAQLETSLSEARRFAELLSQKTRQLDALTGLSP